MATHHRIEPVEELQVYGAGSPRTAIRHWHLAEGDDVEQTDEPSDFDTNELTDGGETCVRCGAAIAAGEFIRRTASGGVEHEACPDDE